MVCAPGNFRGASRVIERVLRGLRGASTALQGISRGLMSVPRVLEAFQKCSGEIQGVQRCFKGFQRLFMRSCGRWVGIWRYLKVSSETSSRSGWGASEGFRDVLWGLKGISGTLRGVLESDMGFHERRLRRASGDLRNVSGGFWGIPECFMRLPAGLR